MRSIDLTIARDRRFTAVADILLLLYFFLTSIGYFENRYGEQWIFTYDRENETAVLRGGDTGWNSGFSVVDGVAEGLILSNEEQLWLRACWAAVQA